MKILINSKPNGLDGLHPRPKGRGFTPCQDKDAVWVTIPLWGRTKEKQDFAKRTWNDPRFRLYRWFYQIPVFDSLIKNEYQTCGYFRDMRFGGVGSENGTPFVFGICEKKDGTSFRAQLTNGMVKNLDWKN